jgi:uncharacterized protein RhaS with RHS repeats
MNIGLQYNHARWYDASIGKWISQDPLGFEAGDSNLYRYVNNRPMDAVDPSGKEIRLYTRSVLGHRHVTVMVYDPAARKIVMFDGGGSISCGTQCAHPNPARHPKGQGMGSAHELDEEQTPDGYYKARYHDREVSEGIVVKTEKTAAEELAALDGAFNKMQQIPYSAYGPNSNTFARQLLMNAGFGRQPAPPGATGWDYSGGDGYDGVLYDEFGKARPAAEKAQKFKETGLFQYSSPESRKRAANWSRHEK